MNKILTYQSASRIARSLKKDKKRIVLVSGCYDLLHPGHVFFFQKAKKYGDVLVVSLGSDKTIRQLKGKSRPVIDEKLRAQMIAALEVVDYVVVDKEKITMPGKINFEMLLKIIRPEVFAVNNTDSAIPEKSSMVAKYGAQLKLVDVTKGPDISSTKIINKIKAS